MIFGKISPVLSKATQDTLFNPTPEYITGSYVAALADRYILGVNKVNFRVLYGNCAFENGQIVGFNTVHADNVVLSGSTIDNWGTDDSTILDIIATQQGTSVTEILTASYNGRFMI